MIAQLFQRRSLALAVMLGLVFSLGLLPILGWAESDIGLTEAELATVVLLQDHRGIQAKLGGTPCAAAIPHNSETASYFYRTPEGSYLRFVVNRKPSDVDYQLVESMTMSLDPIPAGVCDRSLNGTLNGHSPNIGTAKGVRLGDSIQTVTRLYGEPKEKSPDNTGALRLRYDWDHQVDHYYEWNLVFRDGRLVQWTAEAFPVFIEVP